jgi:hypothetical protein
MDGMIDWGEYVFGGNPTNPSEVGTLPEFDATSGNYIFSLIGDNTIRYSVLTKDDLVYGSWGTNGPIAITANDGVLSNYTEIVGTATNQMFIKLLVE